MCCFLVRFLWFLRVFGLFVLLFGGVRLGLVSLFVFVFGFRRVWLVRCFAFSALVLPFLVCFLVSLLLGLLFVGFLLLGLLLLCRSLVSVCVGLLFVLVPFLCSASLVVGSVPVLSLLRLLLWGLFGWLLSLLVGWLLSVRLVGVSLFRFLCLRLCVPVCFLGLVLVVFVCGVEALLCWGVNNTDKQIF